MKKSLLLAALLSLAFFEALSQCAVLTQLRDKTFVANGQCAPVEVTQLTVTYNFSITQDPNDVLIRFIWNDPGNNIDDIDLASGDLMVSNANKTYEATGSFTYDRDANCSFEAEVYIVVDGVQCDASQETSLIYSWDDDDDFGGQMVVNPNGYEVCETLPFSDLVFTDNSTFNCNVNQSPDNPNELTRYTQFVYGTNHDPTNAVLNLTVEDGGVQQVTDATGALVSAETRGTAGELVTGGYFGPIVEVAFPAQQPNNESYPISGDASTLGATFELTLFNWNTCNEYNGDPDDPNYEDAVREVVTITVVDEPVPDFRTRLNDATGAIQTLFCIEENIYFENLTTGGANAHFWEFYEDNTGTTLASSSNLENPTYAFSSGGEKLIRLTASNDNVAGDCQVIFENTITISPDALADFEIYDAAFVSLEDPTYCFESGISYTLGFRDATTNVQPQTEWRYEFYDESDVIIETAPTDGTYQPSAIGDFTKTFSGGGYTIVRLVARNNITLCESRAEDTVFIYGLPIPDFAAETVCAGTRTNFSSIADSANLTAIVDDNWIGVWDWDFSYDGTFKTELSRSSSDDFEWFLDGTDILSADEPDTSVAGTFTVALRTTTKSGDCSEIFTREVVVLENPDVDLSTDAAGEVCPSDLLEFRNESLFADATSYSLSIFHDSSGYLNQFSLDGTDTLLLLPNPDDSLRTYEIQLTAESVDGCQNRSPVVEVEVSPEEDVGFFDPSISFFQSNCSPWEGTFFVDESTQALGLESYEWFLSGPDGLLADYPRVIDSADAGFDSLVYTISHVEETSGTYQAVLTGDKSGFCIANDTLSFQISPQPDSTFAIELAENCESLDIVVEANQQGLVSYTWAYDPVPDLDEGSSEQRILSFSRSDTGLPNIDGSISLVTTNLAGCESERATETIQVASRLEEIDVSFELSADTIKLPENTVLIANTSSDRSDLSYLWDFGNGLNDISRDPVNSTYDRFGTYDISLVISDPFCTVESSRRLVVLPADPIIDFQADTLQGCAPLTVRFTNLSEFAESGEYLWEFGDGSISRADNPVFTFFGDGVYSVRLRGQNEVGVNAESEKTDYITVYGLPFADFLATPRVVYIPDQQVFFRNLSDNGTTYYWEFGDGEISTEFEPRHSYLDEGSYDILLAVVNDLGCTDTLFRATEVTAIRGGEVNSPNAFTPSTAGPTGGSVGGVSDPTSINDVFLPKAEGVNRFRMLIYNKWGQLLFESTDQSTGWDGYFNGRLAPAGVYVYKLELRYSDGRDVVKVGDVTLIR